MNTENTHTVGALYVDGYGAMSADTAREILETVERLNTENRELTTKATDLEAKLIATHERNHEEAVRLGEAFTEGAHEIVAERDQLRERIERLDNAVTELDRNLSDARNENDRLRYADIEPDDNRVAHLWEKAYRYASGAGFCDEFERIAEALGIPAQSLAWSGVALVDVTVSVPVPVSGYANRADITAGDVEAEGVDEYEIADALNNRDWSRYDIGAWTVDSVEDVIADDE